MFYKNIEYYRICRTWDNRKIKIQRYVRIGETEKQKKQSELEALAIDNALQERQKAHRALIQNNGEIYFHDTGKVIGINRVCHITNRRGGRENHIYDVRFNPKRINPRSNQPIRSTTVSIDRYGLLGGYELAILKLAQFAGIRNNGQLLKLMLKSFKYYSFDPTKNIKNFTYDGRGKIDPISPLETRLRIDFDESGKKLGLSNVSKIEKNLLAELEDYQRKNPVPKKHQQSNISNW